jgi:enoyl-CoA hydratase/carnithine racemase
MRAQPIRLDPPAVLPVRAGALSELAGDVAAATDHSPLGAVPWILLALDGSGAELGDNARRALGAWLAQRPCPVIGVRTAGKPADPLSGYCDVVVPADEVEMQLRRIASAPLAAAILVQTLRVTASLPVVDALVVESLAYATLQAGPEFGRWLVGRSVRPTATGVADRALVRLEREGPRLTITLDRARRRNAVSTGVRDALVEAFELAAADPGLTEIAVRGAGPDFCAGGDLDEFGTTPDPATAHIVRSLRQPSAALLACRERVRFEVHGACIGAGAELAAFGREVSATPDAYFQLPELGFGLIPGAGGCVSLPRRIGRQRTAWLAIGGQRIDAATALEWGLVDRIVERGAR